MPHRPVQPGRDRSGHAAPSSRKYLDEVMYEQGVVHGSFSLTQREGFAFQPDKRQGASRRSSSARYPEQHRHPHVPVICRIPARANNEWSSRSASPCLPRRANGAVTGYLICAINMSIMDDSLGIINLGKTGQRIYRGLDREGRMLFQEVRIFKHLRRFQRLLHQ